MIKPHFICYLLLVLVLLSPPLFGQVSVTDSLLGVLAQQGSDTGRVKTLNALGRQFINQSQPERGLPYVQDALAISKRIDYKKGLQVAYKNLGLIYRAQNEIVEARQNFTEALKLSEELKDKSTGAELRDAIAQCYTIEENYAEALKLYYSSLKYWEELGNKRRIAGALDGISFILFYQQNYGESLKQGLRALELYKAIGDKERIARSYSTSATTFYRIHDYSKALEYNVAARKIYEDVNDNAGMFYIFQGLGDINYDMARNALASGQHDMATSKFSESELNYEKSLNAAELSKDTFLITEASANLGNICIELKQYPKSKYYLDKSLALSTGSKEHLKTAYENLTRLDSATGNYKEAYLNYKLSVLYRDSLVNEKSLEKSVHAKVQYEYEKKEALANAAQDKKDQIAKRTRDLQSIAIAAVLVIAVLLFWYSRQKQKAKAKIEKAYSQLESAQAQLIQSEKMASLGELTAGIAHEIQNPLNFVNNFSEVNADLIKEMIVEVDQGNTTEVKAIANDLIQNSEKISFHGKRADAIVKGMLQHSHASTGQKESTDINTLANEYLRLGFQAMRSKDKDFEATLKTDFDSTIGKINIIPQDLGRVLLNLYSNAFYAVNEKRKSQTANYEPAVSVTTKKEKNKVTIVVFDNGAGIPQKIIDKIFQPFFTTKPTGQGTGLGLSLAYDIVKAQGGELHAESREGEFSQLTVVLPT